MHAKRKQRLIAIVALLIGLGVATTFTLAALNENLDHFYSPTEVAEGKIGQGKRFRLGGLVEENSTERSTETLEVNFVITDKSQSTPVRYSGILPDLFKEGQGIIATGSLEDGVFVATQVLAKHDETYMPPEVADALAKAEADGKSSYPESAQ